MLRKVLPHVAIVLSNMYIVFYLIDRVNSAMAFIDNGLTKFLLVLLALISTFNASLLIRENRRRVTRGRSQSSMRMENAPRMQASPVRRPQAQSNGYDRYPRRNNGYR